MPFLNKKQQHETKILTTRKRPQREKKDKKKQATYATNKQKSLYSQAKYIYNNIRYARRNFERHTDKRLHIQL